jgi:predicted TIM-barrel fold metal-dependent hydrolase
VTTADYTGSWPTSIQFLFSSPAFGWHAEAAIHVLRLILSGALDRHPGLKLLSGHWGELVAGWLDRLDDVVRDNVAEFLEKADLTDDERTAIAHRNAETLMRI